MKPRIRDAAIGLMSRDHIGDVRRLDSILGKKESATLSSFVPPNPYVGDPSNLVPGECVALIGINPRLDRTRPGFQHFEIDVPNRCQIEFEQTNNSRAFDPWFEKLHRYYDEEYCIFEGGENIDPYYWPYFTKLGNHIGRAWFDSPPPEKGPVQPNARKVLGNHVLKIDAVPYYSISDEFDAGEVRKSMGNDAAMKAHKKLLETLFEECRPRHLQVNGKNTAGTMIKDIFGKRELFEMRGEEKTPTEIEVGFVNIGKHRLPIMIHKFTGNAGGPQSPESFLECAKNFDDWLKDQL
tara:strand:- start:150 stop:1034 length:885 start_codon:yes stop_codon:yes gene_type:complete